MSTSTPYQNWNQGSPLQPKKPNINVYSLDKDQDEDNSSVSNPYSGWGKSPLVPRNLSPQVPRLMNEGVSTPYAAWTGSPLVPHSPSPSYPAQYICDNCDEMISGHRFHSLTDDNFDLCTSCFKKLSVVESNVEHKFQRIRVERPNKTFAKNAMEKNAPSVFDSADWAMHVEKSVKAEKPKKEKMTFAQRRELAKQKKIAKKMQDENTPKGKRKEL